MLNRVRERLGSELDRAAHAVAACVSPPTGTPPEAPSEEERATLQARVRRLGQLVAGLPALEADGLSADRVGYGSAVELEDLATGERLSYMLVTGDVIDLDEDQVTMASPVGRALLDHRAGQRVEVDLPQGRKRYRIATLTTLPQMLGLARAPRSRQR